MKAQSDNPYVGPESFTTKDKEFFFGRENEARDLLSLVLSSRAVLFYAQSGAGKTSLINARLVPGLEREGFEVLTLGRVSGEAAPGQQVDNIFVYNLLLSVDDSGKYHERFAKLELKDFLVNLAFDEEKKVYYYDDHFDMSADEEVELPAGEDTVEEYKIWPRALIIDQFEEILTTHPESWQKREDFFRQVCEALEYDEYLWVIFSMREDYVTALHPYTHLLPGGLRTRFYMQQLGTDAALEAVKIPAKKKNRPYQEGVAEKLVKELASIRTKQPDGSIISVPGQFVEPVQLQVVCYRLWESLSQQDEAKDQQNWTNLYCRPVRLNFST